MLSCTCKCLENCGQHLRILGHGGMVQTILRYLAHESMRFCKNSGAVEFRVASVEIPPVGHRGAIESHLERGHPWLLLSSMECAECYHSRDGIDRIVGSRARGKSIHEPNMAAENISTVAARGGKKS